MARQLDKLSAPKVRGKLAPGRHSDGGGLYLVVDKPTPAKADGTPEKPGARRWIFLYRWNGKLTEMGLGGLNSVTQAKAREKAGQNRAWLADGKNPLVEARRQDPTIPTFGEMSDQHIEAMKSEWRNAKHIAQWEMTMKVYAKPLRGVRVDLIATEHVLRVLQPIWKEKPETASRVRGRIERVLAAAQAKGYRSGDNPARWRGHLDTLLSKPPLLSRGHHLALPFADVPALVTRLRTADTMACKALEFTILTAARTSEALGATWGEFDLEANVWTVPAERMKSGREHRVPLTPRAVEIVQHLQAAKISDYVFPGQKHRRPLSSMSMAMLLRRLEIEATPHGFRSSFRDWVSEASSFPGELAEHALAHVQGGKTEQAYRRGDALEKRRKLMQAWASYCAKTPANVTPIRRGAA